MRPAVVADVGWQVSVLLDPHAGAVPFAGREEDLTGLRAWCTDDRAGRVRLVTGSGGAGKTRLALRLAQELAESGWSCEWVRDGREAVAVSAIRGVSRGRVLLIIDYAETRTGLEDLLRAAAADTGAAMRVLLLQATST